MSTTGPSSRGTSTMRRITLAGSCTAEGLQTPQHLLESSTVNCRQSRRQLEYMKDNFLSQVIDSPTRRNATLDLVVTREIRYVNSGAACAAASHTGGVHSPKKYGWGKEQNQDPELFKKTFQLFKAEPSGNCPQEEGSRTDLVHCLGYFPKSRRALDHQV